MKKSIESCFNSVEAELLEKNKVVRCRPAIYLNLKNKDLNNVKKVSLQEIFQTCSKNFGIINYGGLVFMPRPVNLKKEFSNRCVITVKKNGEIKFSKGGQNIDITILAKYIISELIQSSRYDNASTKFLKKFAEVVAIMYVFSMLEITYDLKFESYEIGEIFKSFAT